MTTSEVVPYSPTRPIGTHSPAERASGRTQPTRPPANSSATASTVTCTDRPTPMSSAWVSPGSTKGWRGNSSSAASGASTAAARPTPNRP